MSFISDELIDALNRSSTRTRIRDSEFAHAIKISPSYFSKIKTRAVKIRPDDPRIIELGQILSIPPERCTTPEVDK